MEVNKKPKVSYNETLIKKVEEEGADAMEVAAQTVEKRKA